MEPFEVDEFPSDSEITQMFDCTLIVKIPASFIYKISQTQDVLNVKIQGVKFGLTHLKGASYISEGFTTAMIVFEKPTSIPEVVGIHHALAPLANDVGAFMKHPLLEKVLISSGNEELIQEGMQIIRNKVRTMAQEGADRGRPPPYYSRGPYPQPRAAAIRPRQQPELRVSPSTNSAIHSLRTPMPLTMVSQNAPRDTFFGPYIPPPPPLTGPYPPPLSGPLPPPLTYMGTNTVTNKTDLVNTRADLQIQPQNRVMPRLIPQRRAVAPWASQPSATATQDHVCEQQWSPRDAYSGASGSSVQPEAPNALASRNVMVQNFHIQQNIYESQVIRRREDPPPYELPPPHSVRNDVNPNNQLVNVHKGRGMLNQPSASYCAPVHSEYNEIKYSTQQQFQMPPEYGQQYASSQAVTIKKEQFFETDMYKRTSDQNAYSNEYNSGAPNHNVGNVEKRNGYGYGNPTQHATRPAQERMHGGIFKRETSDISYQPGFKTDQSGTMLPYGSDNKYNTQYNGWTPNHNGDFGNRNGYVTETRYPTSTAHETVPNGGGLKCEGSSHFSYPQVFSADQCKANGTKPRTSEPPLYNEQCEQLPQTHIKHSELTTDDLDQLQKIFEDFMDESEYQPPIPVIKAEVVDSDDDCKVVSGYWNE